MTPGQRSPDGRGRQTDAAATIASWRPRASMPHLTPRQDALRLNSDVVVDGCNTFGVFGDHACHIHRILIGSAAA
jgi:hypothetical protein